MAPLVVGRQIAPASKAVGGADSRVTPLPRAARWRPLFPRTQVGGFFRFWSRLGQRSAVLPQAPVSSAFEKVDLNLVLRVPFSSDDLPLSPDAYAIGAVRTHGQHAPLRFPARPGWGGGGRGAPAATVT